MKKYFVFDKLDTDAINLDENTINIQTGVSTDRIKSSVMSGIKSRHRSKRKLAVLLAAAVLSSAVLGTAAGASGAFDSIFGDYFQSDTSQDIYISSNAQLHINEGYNGQFLGTSGDDTSAFAAVTISKSDGSNMVDDINNCFIEVDDGMDLSKNQKHLAHPPRSGFTIKTDLDDIVFDELNIDWYSANFDCMMTSPDTMKVIFSLNTGETTILNRDVEFILGPYLHIYHIDEVVQNLNVDDNVSDILEQKKDLCSSLNDDQVLRTYYNRDTQEYKLVIATKTTIRPHIKLNVHFDYEPSSRSIDVTEEDIFEHNGNTAAFTDISIGKFTTKIKVKSEFQDTELFRAIINCQDVSLTMKDGTEIKCTSRGGGSPVYSNHNYYYTFTGHSGGNLKSRIEENGYINGYAHFTYTDESGNYVVINPDDVVLITFGKTYITCT